ncbi:MAG TPA: hypothetical protein VJR06_10105, partial [Nitrososphaerales archaeon]|nr:hypothetical protein [Nitrososphaerales archaeon]
KEGAGPASEFEEARDLAGAAPALRELDRSVLGFPLEWTHDFLFETKARCLLFRDRGVPVGYAYVRGNGAVGPMAVGASGYSRQVLETALRVSAAQGVEKVRFYFPGSNRHAVDLAARYRMKIEPLVFMSTEPFAKWENYVFHSAALM